MNRHEKLLLLSLIVLEDTIKKHREKCSEWSYSPKLKMSLTNSHKAILECIEKIPGEVFVEDNIFLKNKLDTFHRGRGSVKMEGDTIVDLNDFIELPENFLNDIVTIINILDYARIELEITIERKIKKEFKHFENWFKHFEYFLKDEIFI